MAAAALLARHWPTQGTRHEAALALSGILLRAGWDLTATTTFLEAVAQAAGTSGKKKAKRLMRKGIKALKQAAGIAAKAAKKGEISAACGAAVATELGNTKAGADRWLHTR